jgi:hypothetical protein
MTIEPGGTTMVVLFAGGDGLLLLKELNAQSASGGSKTAKRTWMFPSDKSSAATDTCTPVHSAIG